MDSVDEELRAATKKRPKFFLHSLFTVPVGSRVSHAEGQGFVAQLGFVLHKDEMIL